MSDLKKYPPTTGQNKHLAAYEPKFILDQRGKEKRTFKVGENHYLVKMNSGRYHTFAESLNCVCCGLEGVVMMLDVQPSVKHGIPHFNLYGEWHNGDLILMTKDHIIPRSKGGLNAGKNYQTMCTLCNAAKKNKSITLEALREIDSVRDRIKLLSLIGEVDGQD
tara:strand:- start:298 stop:789 length:492 start_codon:yes stop_codon:yes gene_type:complete